MKDDRIYLEHISRSLQKIIKYVGDLDYVGFLKNEMVQDAIIRQFEIIGEATKRLSMELRNNYPELPWRQMAGMRDKLIHEYLAVDLDVVWISASEETFDLLIKIEAILESPLQKSI